MLLRLRVGIPFGRAATWCGRRRSFWIRFCHRLVCCAHCSCLRIHIIQHSPCFHPTSAKSLVHNPRSHNLYHQIFHTGATTPSWLLDGELEGAPSSLSESPSGRHFVGASCFPPGLSSAQDPSDAEGILEASFGGSDVPSELSLSLPTSPAQRGAAAERLSSSFPLPHDDELGDYSMSFEELDDKDSDVPTQFCPPPASQCTAQTLAAPVSDILPSRQPVISPAIFQSESASIVGQAHLLQRTPSTGPDPASILVGVAGTHTSRATDSEKAAIVHPSMGIGMGTGRDPSAGPGRGGAVASIRMDAAAGAGSGRRVAAAAAGKLPQLGITEHSHVYMPDVQVRVACKQRYHAHARVSHIDTFASQVIPKGSSSSGIASASSSDEQPKSDGRDRTYDKYGGAATCGDGFGAVYNDGGACSHGEISACSLHAKPTSTSSSSYAAAVAMRYTADSSFSSEDGGSLLEIASRQQIPFAHSGGLSASR